VHLDEIAEARRQLDEELANLHRALGEVQGPHDPQRAARREEERPRDPQCEQHREGDGE
jgi:hypothetical protein